MGSLPNRHGVDGDLSLRSSLVTRRAFTAGSTTLTVGLVLPNLAVSGSKELYIDPSAADDGDGSSTSPWNTFGHLSYLKGDLGRLKIRIRSSTTATNPFQIEGAWNFSVEVFGGSISPIIDGSTAIAATSWAKEDVFYFINAPTHHAIFIADQRLTKVLSKDDLANPMSQWFDETNKRIYVHLTDNGEPGSDARRTNMYYCVQIADCREFILEGIEARRSYDSGFILNSYRDNIADGVVAECIARDCGSYASIAGDSFLLWGRSADEKSQRLVVKGCKSYNPVNCGYELNWLKDFSLTGNAEESAGTSIEMYRGCTDGEIARNMLRSPTPRAGFGTGTAIWFSHSGIEAGCGGHRNITIAANLISGAATQGVDLQAGTGHVVTNNTFYNCGGTSSVVRVAKPGLDDVDLQLTNNVLYTPTVNPYNIDVAQALGGAVFSDFNLFFGGTSHFLFEKQYCADLSAWRAISGQDLNSKAVDPGFRDAASGDFSIKTGGGALGAGEPRYAPFVDYEGRRYGDPPNAGAL